MSHLWKRKINKIHRAPATFQRGYVSSLDPLIQTISKFSMGHRSARLLFIPAHDPASSSSRSLFPLDDAVADVSVVAAGPVAVVWRPSSWVTVMMGSSGSSMGTCGDFPVELGKWLGGVGIVMLISLQY